MFQKAHAVNVVRLKTIQHETSKQQRQLTNFYDFQMLTVVAKEKSENNHGEDSKKCLLEVFIREIPDFI
jgi:hypothetical protein